MSKLNFKSNISFEDVEKMSDEEIKNLTPEDHNELARLRAEKSHIKHTANIETNAQDLRNQVLKHSVKAIERVQEVLHSGEKLTPEESQAYDMLWPIIENMISKTEDLKVIEAKNSSEIISAVIKGRMTMQEGSAMMALFKDQVTIEELPKLLARLEEQGES